MRKLSVLTIGGKRKILVGQPPPLQVEKSPCLHIIHFVPWEGSRVFLKYKKQVYVSTVCFLNESLETF